MREKHTWRDNNNKAKSSSLALHSKSKPTSASSASRNGFYYCLALSIDDRQITNDYKQQKTFISSKVKPFVCLGICRSFIYLFVSYHSNPVDSLYFPVRRLRIHLTINYISAPFNLPEMTSGRKSQIYTNH